MAPANGADDASVLLSALGMTPMFGGAGPIPYTGPFNFGTSAGGLGTFGMMFGPMLLQPLLGQQWTPAQFFPTQSYYDQFRARELFMESWAARQRATRRDQEQLAITLAGAMQLLHRRPLSMSERHQAFQIARQMEQMLPMLAMFVGHDMLDALYGRSGSAMLLGEAIHRAGRLLPDPSTGRWEMRGQTAATIASEVFAQLYGTPTRIAQMRGVGAGESGRLYEEAVIRGFAPASIGQLTPLERAREMAALDLRDPARLARAVQSLLDRTGRAPTPENIQAAEVEILRTQEGVQTALRRGQERQILAALQAPGADVLLPMVDANRIAGYLKKMSGVVNAMRDVFGDLGRPNAPMRELINGLQALTQGGMLYLSPAELEHSVRTFKNVARKTGMGAQNLVGLMAQVAGETDARGVNRAFAPMIAQQAALFGAAFGVTQAHDVPAWGAYNKEEATLKDSQLRTQAAGSDVANRINALLRMRDLGLLRGQAKAVADQIAQGRGVPQGLDMSMAGWQRMLSDSGISLAVAQSFHRDIAGNQEYGVRYDTTNLVRNVQWSYQLAPMLARNLSHVFMGGARQSAALGQALSRMTPAQQDQVFQALGTGVMAHLHANVAQMRTPTERQRTIRTAITQQLRQQLTATGLNDAAATAILREMEQTGVIAQLAAGIETEGNVLATQMGYKSLYGMLQLHAPETMRRHDRLRADTETEVALEKALSGLGRASPLRRVIDAIRNASPTTSWTDILAKSLGAVNIEEEIQANPTLGAIHSVIQRFRDAERDASGFLTDRGIRQRAWASQTITAMIEGGEAAQAWLTDEAKRRKITVHEKQESQYQRELAKILANTTLNADQKREVVKELWKKYPQSRDAQLAKAVEASKDATEQARFMAVMSAALGEPARVEAARRGWVTQQNVGPEEAAAVLRRAAVLDASLTALAQAQPQEQSQRQQLATENAELFVNTVQAFQTALLDDETAVSRLGKGGVARLQAFGDKLTELRRLAQEASKAGKKVSVAELLAGKGPPEAQARAKTLYQELQKEVQSLQEALDPLRAQTTPLSQEEKEQLTKERERVAAEAAPPEERKAYEHKVATAAGEQLRRLAKSLGTDLQDTDLSILVQKMAKRGIGGRIGEALAARERLWKQLSQDKALAALASEKGMSQAVAALQEATPPEQRDELDRLIQQAQPFLDVSRSSAIQDLEKQIDELSTKWGRDLQSEEATGRPGKDKLTITGTVTIKNAKEAILELTSLDLGEDGATFPA